MTSRELKPREQHALLLIAECFENGGPLEDWMFDDYRLVIAAALRDYARRSASPQQGEEK